MAKRHYKAVTKEKKRGKEMKRLDDKLKRSTTLRI